MKKKKVNNFWYVYLIVACFFGWLILIPIFNDNIKNDNNSKTTIEKINDKFSSIEESHWTHMPLTYKIYDCSKYQYNRIVKAFNRIENETKGIVSFVSLTNVNFPKSLPIDCYGNCDVEYIQKEEKADIEVFCLYYEKDYDLNKAYETLGEAINYPYLDNPNKIKSANIYFHGITSSTYSHGCVSYMDVEIHEILHVLGFGHVSNLKHIMYPLHIRCPSKLDNDILSCLNKIYSNGTFSGNCSGIKMYKACKEGYILGEDYECHKECLKGYYCLKGTSCRNGQCYGCQEGYYLGEDELCYPEGTLGSLKFFFHSGQSPILLSVNLTKTSLY